ncbi:hypothetical protein QJS04_geneDACA012924 [Acorus gramineus]|uniref:Uncharacterized protein n=1 Tax=Acorus gramineus TaxID=55184 RepID=A0AAV9B7F2_ACOGR|nr:hypothetical protein QJS04_geneDACA012924 [Acorus gramineus]
MSRVCICPLVRHLQHLKKFIDFPVKYLVDIDAERFLGLFDNIKSLDLHLKSHSVKITNDGCYPMNYLKAIEVRSFRLGEHISELDFERFPGTFDNVQSLDLCIPSHSAEPINGIIVAGLRHFRCLEELSIEGFTRCPFKVI